MERHRHQGGTPSRDSLGGEQGIEPLPIGAGRRGNIDVLDAIHLQIHEAGHQPAVD